jgi:NOL1/NOP2/sun family putative RNA methylase
MTLPQEFQKKMQKLLGEEYGQFLESYQREPLQALRVNTLKMPVEEFQSISPFSLRPVPWASEGFYYEKVDRPGKHPYHEAGLYYIQEPSAMAVGALALPKPGERVLDLCAAPGGKTTHLASAMKGQGLLISNEIHSARAKILSTNVERMGIPNAIVTNETPESLAGRFPGFFDRIVVDAPCSGEGMFQKEEQAILQWSPENVSMCAGRQQAILEEAAKMLRPGGSLVYSTCTFAPEENEGTVSTFLKKHSEFSICQVPVFQGFSPGRPEWVDALPETAGTFRLWPHHLEGQGHFAAVLKKEGEAFSQEYSRKLPQVDRATFQLYETFTSENLTKRPEGIPVLFGEQLYFLPCAISLKGLKVLRAGLHMGTVKKNRFEPSHALALSLKKQDVLRSFCLDSKSLETAAYLRGESLQAEGEKGWRLVLVDGFSLGWGKQTGGTLKNHYPKGLRWT